MPSTTISAASLYETFNAEQGTSRETDFRKLFLDTYLKAYIDRALRCEESSIISSDEQESTKNKERVYA